MTNLCTSTSLNARLVIETNGPRKDQKRYADGLGSTLADLISETIVADDNRIHLLQ